TDDNSEPRDSEADGTNNCEPKLLQAITNSSNKLQQTRLKAFRTIAQILMHHHIPEYISKHSMTLMDALDKSLRRAQQGELVRLSRMSLELVRKFKPLLLAMIQDVVSCDVPSDCCIALGNLIFIEEGDHREVFSHMNVLQDVLERDNNPCKCTWSLLLTLLPPKYFHQQFCNGAMISVAHFLGFLTSTHLEVRLAAGETIALMVELGRQHEPSNILAESLPATIGEVQKLAIDARRYRAKHDRMTQLPERCIKFDHEKLALDSWLEHLNNRLRKLFGSGLNVQLKENCLVRDLLHLGPKVDEPSKQHRTTSNAATSKDRTVARAEHRQSKQSLGLE
uniref:Uncharacterized protein n=1 Tax=Anopheles dirus TaxID=7168 RepID=A0A182NPE0_9DIPT